MVSVYLLAGLSIGVILWRILFSKKPNLKMGFVAKTLASLFFFLAGVSAAFYVAGGMSSIKVQLMVIALALALVGDIILALPSYAQPEFESLFSSVGGISFFAGHILYIVAFFIGVEFNYYLIPVLLIPPLLFCLLIRTRLMTPGKNTIPILAYSVILGVLLLSVVNMISYKMVQGYLALPASILFIISDASLFVYNFGVDERSRSRFVKNYLVLLPYFIAQSIFAISITLL
ncbi:MAG: lysoplasmalogenase [Christensenellaceae bacterium]|jgi:uncharacterized membrane protein YhhN|nr:lysoplasmalogenase [Christensenellaceae bacterium]